MIELIRIVIGIPLSRQFNHSRLDYLFRGILLIILPFLIVRK